jgi:ribonuclease P protein subunit POP4
MSCVSGENLIKHELIGFNCSVVSSSNPYQVGIEGRVTNETKCTLTITTESGSKMVQKRGTHLAFYLKNGSITFVKGEQINARPYERVARNSWRKAR